MEEKELNFTIDNTHFELNDNVLFVDAISSNTEWDSGSSKVETINVGKANVVAWGKDNLLPQRIIELVKKSTDLSSALAFNVDVAYGGGVCVVKKVKGEDGKIKWVEVDPSDHEKVKTFLDANNVNAFLKEQLTDLYWFGNTFCEFVFPKGKDEIRLLKHREAAFSRLFKKDKKGALTRHAYSQKWDEANPQPLNTTVLDARRPLFDMKVRLGSETDINNSGHYKKMQGRRFVMVTADASPAAPYYKRPSWYSVFDSGWYDIAVQIPVIKRAILENQLRIKYIVEIDNKYYNKIAEKQKITEEAKYNEMVDAEKKKISDWLKKSKGDAIFFSEKEFQPTKNGGYDEFSHIKVTVVDTKKQGGEYIKDTEEASNILYNALKVHPSIVGIAPGKSASLSGSDKRELFIMKQVLSKADRDRITAIFDLIKEVNDWPKDIYLRIKDIELTTLDKNKNGKEEKVNG